MKIYRDEKRIEQRAKIGKYAGIASLLILGGGMYLSFQFKTQIWYSLIALILGFALSQISIYFTNQYGRSPRPDQVLDEALKGLDDRYALYHYTTPVSHLLIGPAGIWILLPYHQKGKITYNEKKEEWDRKGGNLYLKFFAQDSIGRPSTEIESAKDRVKTLLKSLPDLDTPPLHAALVFTHQDAKVEADNAPSPTLHALQLKKFIRKQEKGKRSLSMSTVRTAQDALEFE